MKVIVEPLGYLLGTAKFYQQGCEIASVSSILGGEFDVPDDIGVIDFSVNKHSHATYQIDTSKGTIAILKRNKLSIYLNGWFYFVALFCSITFTGSWRNVWQYIEMPFIVLITAWALFTCIWIGVYKKKLFIVQYY